MTKPILAMPSLWAILPEEISAINHAYIEYLQGNDIDAFKIAHPHADVPVAGILDIDLDKVPQSFFMNGDIGVLPIEGVITPKADFFSMLFGGSTIDVITRDFKALIEDDSVKAIVLDIDSPGGVVFGGLELADLIFSSRAIKPIFTISPTVMASLAMLIGAAASEIFITGEAVVTGSLGIITNHIDTSELERKIGVKITTMVAGRLKALRSSHKPLSDEDKAEIQGQLEHVYSALIADIARFKGVDTDTAHTNMADGRIFMGSQGIEAGLIDKLLSAEELIDRINAEINKSEGNINTFIGGKDMGAIAAKDMSVIAGISAKDLEEINPQVHQAIFNAGVGSVTDKINNAKIDGFEEGKVEGKGIGAKNEMARIKDVYARMSPGYEEKVAGMMFDGKTTGVECGDVLHTAMEGKRKQDLATMEAEAESSVGNDQEAELQAGERNEDDDKKDFKTLVAEYKEEHKCSEGVAITAVAKSHPGKHKEYVKGMSRAKV